MTKVVYEKYGRVYIPINVKLKNGVDMVPTLFKVDTGADKSTISKTDLDLLGFDMDWIRENVVKFGDAEKPSTASGDRVNAGYVQLPLINILGYEGKYWPFQVVIDENKNFRNLLGRDLLTGFNYCFNSDEDIFSIERAGIFKPRYPFLPNQEINEIYRRWPTTQ